MVAFGLLLAIGVLLAQGPPVDRQEGGRVTFTEADLAQVSATFERTWSRPPTAAELRSAFERYVRDEVFYREAIARGLDRNDPVVKMSLVRKITMLGTAAAQATEPTDAEIRAFFELRTERYRIPATFDLMQVYLNPEKRGRQLDAHAATLLTELRDARPETEKLSELGDVIMLPRSVQDVSQENLAHTFGRAFADAVLTLPVGRWEGPVESEFGLHLVNITRRVDAQTPDWTQIRDVIIRDMQYEGRKAAEDQFYAEILPRYQIVYSNEVDALLEGAGPGNTAP